MNHIGNDVSPLSAGNDTAGGWYDDGSDTDVRHISSCIISGSAKSTTHDTQSVESITSPMIQRLKHLAFLVSS